MSQTYGKITPSAQKNLKRAVSVHHSKNIITQQKQLLNTDFISKQGSSQM
jgi:hypothetical protein